MGQLADHSWSHFCYSLLIIPGSAGRAQLVILLLLSTHKPWISWQGTTGHTSATLHSSPVGQLAEYLWSHFGYSPLITRGSAGRVQLVNLRLLSTDHTWVSWLKTLVTLRLLSSHHPCVSWQRTLVTLRLLSTQHPCGIWQSTARHSSVTLHSSPVDQLAKSTGGHTSVTLHSSPVDQLPEYSWSHFGYSPLITRGSAGRAQLVTLLLISTHNPWISWQSTSGHTSINLHSSPMGQLAEHSWSHCCQSPLITRGSAGRAQLVILLLLSTHNP